MLSLSPVSPTAVYMSLDIPAQLDSQAPQACLPPTTHVSGSDFIFNSVQPLLSLICRNYITIYGLYALYVTGHPASIILSGLPATLMQGTHGFTCLY